MRGFEWHEIHHRALRILLPAILGILAFCSVQLAFQAPARYALSLAWGMLGLALLILLALLWVHRIGWIIAGLLTVTGAGFFFVAIMARFHLLGYAFIGLVIFILVGAVTGSRKQIAMRRMRGEA